MRIGLKESIEIKKEDNRLFRRNMLILILVTAAAFLVFMNAYNYAAWKSPAYTWSCIRTWFAYAWATVTHQPRLDIIERYPVGYSFTFSNIKSLFMAMGCGALLLMVCRGVVILMPRVLGQYFPISIIVNIMVPPVFALFLAKSKRGWE